MDIELTEPLRRMPWIEAMEKYGSDKPDLRFGMEFADITDLAKGHGFSVFDDAEYITGFAATGCAAYTRKQIEMCIRDSLCTDQGPHAGQRRKTADA